MFSEKDNHGLVWETNKGKFSIKEGGKLLDKQYFRNGIAIRDFYLLQKISQIYVPDQFNKYVYKAIRVYFYSQQNNSFSMEYIQGQNLRELFRETKCSKLFFHAGYWIGILHKSSVDSLGNVIVFNDYNRSNIIINIEGKIIVAVDPGEYSQLKTHPSVSIFIMGYSIIRGALKENWKTIFPSVKAFYRGYNSTGFNIKYTLIPGAIYLMKRFAKGISKPAIKKPYFARIFFGLIEVLIVYAVLFTARRHSNYDY